MMPCFCGLRLCAQFSSFDTYLQCRTPAKLSRYLARLGEPQALFDKNSLSIVFVSISITLFGAYQIFSRVQATLEAALSVGRSVGPSIGRCLRGARDLWRSALFSVAIR